MAARVAVLLTVLIPLAGCGASLEAADPAADVHPIPASEACPATVMRTLGSVLKYKEDADRVKSHGVGDLVRAALTRAG